MHYEACEHRFECQQSLAHQLVRLVCLFSPRDSGWIRGNSNPRTPIEHVVVDGAGVALHECPAGLRLDGRATLAPDFVEESFTDGGCCAVRFLHFLEEVLVEFLSFVQQKPTGSRT